jgi:uncharacterized repeat protein (TIGR01451 family)
MSNQVSSFDIRQVTARRLLLLGLMLSVTLVVWIRQAAYLIEQPLDQLVDPSSLIFIPSPGTDSNKTRSTEQFTALSASGVLDFSPTSIVFNLRDPGAVGEGSETAARQITLDFLDANPETAIEPGRPLSGKANLYLGDDPALWGTGLDTFGGVTYRELYPGIDLAYEGLDGQLKGNYLLAPGANPALIRWRYTGINQAAVDPTSGELRLELPDGSYLVEKPPVAWQQGDSGRIPVPAAYAIAGDGSLGFMLGDYDGSRPLTIDPVVVYETIYNAGFVDYGSELEVDDEGNAYVVGYPDFFIIKLLPNGDFDFITLISGSGLDIGRSAALDNMGHIYVTGWTSSDDFPVLNALQSQLNGQTDAFVTKLNTSDGSLVFSTYMGGTRAEEGYDIVYGYDGAIYLTGATDSTNFPITPDALQDHLALINCFCDDAYVSKIAADGSSIIYATYLGGDLTDKAYRIGVDASNNIIIHGTTDSSDFPLQNPLQASYSGEQDTFVSKIVADGSALTYSTYLGGSKVEYVGGLAVDAAGNAHLLGRTQSVNFPTTPGSYQPQFHGDILGCGSPPFEPLRNCDDIYVTKLAPDGAAYTFSTFLGGSRDDNGTDIALDALGQLHIIGHTSSTDFPGNDGSGSANYILVSLLDSTGSDLIRTLQIDSPVSNAGHGIVVDAIGDFYITGGMNVPSDVYVAKFSENGDPLADLSLQVDAYPDPILAGSKLSLAITVENNGPSAAAGVVLTDTLPIGVEFVRAEVGQGTCEENAGQVLCDLGVLSSGHSAEITIVVRTTAGGTLTNTAQVGSDFLDPIAGNNQVDTTVTVLDASSERIIFLPNLGN